MIDCFIHDIDTCINSFIDNDRQIDLQIVDELTERRGDERI